MQLKPLCRYRFTYPLIAGVVIGEGEAQEHQLVGFAEGSVEGGISGSLRGTNHGRVHPDGVGVLDFQGVIETDDGATIVFDYRGYGRPYPAGRRQIVGTVTHLSDHAGYRRLNDVVCVLTGEVCASEDGPTQFVVDIAELV